MKICVLLVPHYQLRGFLMRKMLSPRIVYRYCQHIAVEYLGRIPLGNYELL